eukprot:1671394-Prymnesium_polylepis.1
MQPLIEANCGHAEQRLADAAEDGVVHTHRDRGSKHRVVGHLKVERELAVLERGVFGRRLVRLVGLLPDDPLQAALARPAAHLKAHKWPGRPRRPRTRAVFVPSEEAQPADAQHRQLKLEAARPGDDLALDRTQLSDRFLIVQVDLQLKLLQLQKIVVFPHHARL